MSPCASVIRPDAIIWWHGSQTKGRKRRSRCRGVRQSAGCRCQDGGSPRHLARRPGSPARRDLNRIFFSHCGTASGQAHRRVARGRNSPHVRSGAWPWGRPGPSERPPWSDRPLGVGERTRPAHGPPGCHQPNACTKPRMLSSTMTLPTRIINGWSGIL